MNRPDARALVETLAARAQADAAAGGADDEAGFEELLDYLRGDLAPGDEARVARRLVADPAAARALLDLAELEEAASAADESHLADPETRAGWRDLEARLPAPPQPRRAGFAAWLPAWLSPAFAALLLVVSGGLGVRVAQLEHQLRAPEALLAVEVLLGSRSGEAEAPAGRALALTLAPAGDAAGCRELAAEIVGPAGERRTVTGLTPDDLGLVVVQLPSAAPGRWAVSLTGCGAPFGEGSFRVVPVTGGGGDG